MRFDGTATFETLRKRVEQTPSTSAWFERARRDCTGACRVHVHQESAEAARTRPWLAGRASTDRTGGSWWCAKLVQSSRR